MKTAGLSLDQAPPIDIPFKFFLTASLFSVIIGLLLIVKGEEVFLSRWTPLALGITHLITIGFLAQVMTGAMIQLLPVLAGSPIPAVITISRIIHLSLLSGAILLVTGFIFSHRFSLFAGAGLLAAAFTLFLIAALISLVSSGIRHNNAVSLGLGWLAIVPAVAIGIYLAMGLTGIASVSDMSRLTAIHLSWGVLGWVGIVLFATVFQLIPIFYVTKEIPTHIRHIAFAVIFSLLILYSLSHVIASRLFENSLVLIVMLFLLLGITVLYAIHRRKRKILDITLLFVLTGLVFLVLAAIVWVVGDYDLIVGVLLLGGVCLTIPIGIIYKVIPFLCWFHLQSLQVKQEKFSYSLPSMKHFISDKDAKRHYYLHVGAIFMVIISIVFPGPIVRLSGIVFSLSSIYFLKNVLFAFLAFRREQKALYV
ncbi:MAG: hypothetical protein KZQ93_21210 [Candidatus Thiodiazotropha sp. (ex Monitilora ramsayi)]|nr:hypothetical protein [Candidatus Thiodiazotropha sp. (ex Monitilora ramsayi)]